MIERNPQPSAYIWELRRIDAPGGSCEADRAFESAGRRLDASAFAAGLQNGAVETCVVRREKLDALELQPEFGPQFAKRRRSSDIVPGDPVQIREDEGPSGRANHVVNTPDNARTLDPHDGDSARAVTFVVRRLEVDGSKDRLFHATLSSVLHATPIGKPPGPVGGTTMVLDGTRR